jgi:hypothetical protein
MSQPDTVIINTLEQILSADLNRIGGLAGKAVQDALARIEKGIDAPTTNPRTVVRDGLDATIGTGLSINLTAGELMTFDAGTAGPDVSSYLLGRLDADVVVGGFTPDGVDPRIVLVHGTPITTNSDSQVRNILTLPSRIVTPVASFKSARPDLTVALTHGIPTAGPIAPAPPAGAVPLWYVYLPANATSLDSDHLADGRIRLVPSPHSRDHGRVDGLYMGPSSLTQLTLGSGRGWCNGALLSVENISLVTGVSIFPSGSGSLLLDTEYQLYAVAKGAPGHIVRRGATDNWVPVLTTGNTPLSDGRPSSAVTYRPLYGAATAVNNWVETTTEALYLGSIRTDAAGSFQNGGDGIPLNRDGLQKDLTLLAHRGNDAGGFPGVPNGFFRGPHFKWTSLSSVTVGSCKPIFEGVPGSFSSTVADFATHLAAGEVEQASTWYYVYLRRRLAFTILSRGTSRTYQPVISSEAPNTVGEKPTPEAGGFRDEDYIFVGTFFNNAASDIVEFVKVGNTYHFISTAPQAVTPPGGGGQHGVVLSIDNTAVVPVGSFMPATSIVGIFNLWWLPTVGAVGQILQILSRSSGLSPMANFYVGSATNDGGGAQVFIPVDATTKQWRLFATVGNPDSVDTVVFQNGYVEDLEALPF